jgi:hypothetical protein
MMVSASGVYITMLTGRRDNPDCCIVARDEYTARAQLAVRHWFNPSIAHQHLCRSEAIFRLSA